MSVYEETEPSDSYTLLRQINRLLLKEDNKDSLIESVSSNISSVDGFGCTFVGLVDEGDFKHVCSSNKGVTDAQVKEFHTQDYIETVFEEGVLWMDDVTRSPFRQHPPDTQKHMGLAFPLRYSGRRYGVLTVHIPSGKKANELQVQLLEDIAEDIGFTLHSLQIESQLKKRNRELTQYKSIVEKSTDWVTIVDKGGVIKYVNSPASKGLGFEGEEAVGQKIFDVVHPEDVYLVRQQLEQIVKNPQRGNGPIVSRVQTTNGEYKWLECVASNQLDNPDIRGVIINSRDVTEQKKRELEMSKFMDSIGDPVFIHKIDNPSFIDVNIAAKKKYGYSKGEFLSMGPKTISDEPNKLEERLRRIKSEDKYIFETKHRTKRGHIFPVEISSNLITYKGERAVLSIVRDIKDRKEHEQHLQVFNRFFRHNMRNILNLLQGYTRRLQEDPVNSNADTLSKLENVVTDLGELSEKAYRVNKLMDSHQNDELDVPVKEILKNISGDYPNLVLGDGLDAEVQTSSTIVEAFEELIENAFEYSQKDSRVVVWAEKSDNCVKTFIQDNGPGIPKEEYIGIIKNDELDQINHNSGFGLWLSYWLVQREGGELHFDTSKSGTTVMVQLPRHK